MLASALNNPEVQDIALQKQQVQAGFVKKGMWKEMQQHSDQRS